MYRRTWITSRPGTKAYFASCVANDDAKADISGNTGSIPDAICRLMYEPSNGRGANNNGCANAACCLPPPRR
jgi:hypothetical protein